MAKSQNFSGGITVIPDGSRTPVVNLDDHGNAYYAGDLRVAGTFNAITATSGVFTSTVSASGFIANGSVGATGTLFAASVATVVGGLIVSIT